MAAGVDRAKNPQMFLGNYNIKVAILSTGVDYNHKGLRGQVVINKKEIHKKSIGEKLEVDRKDSDENGLIDDVVGMDVIDGDGFAYDRHGAGTAVAGIIAAQSKGEEGAPMGLMNKVSIFPIRYIDDNGQSSIVNLAAALAVAITIKPHVVYIQNISLSMGENPEQRQAEMNSVEVNLRELQEMKVPVIIGAGDEFTVYGEKGLEEVFRKFSNVIVVNSINKDFKKPFLSKYHTTRVTTAAPGVDILTLGLNNSYTKVSGTSYAAAHVTAAVALAISNYGQHREQARPDKIKRALYSHEGGDYVPDLVGYNRGNNKLNIVKFLTRLKDQN